MLVDLFRRTSRLVLFPETNPMKTSLLLTGCLLLGSVAAQDPVDPQPERAPTPAERMQELQDLQKKAVDEWRASRTNPKKNADGSMPAMRMRPDFGPVAEKALSFAKDYAGTDDAVDFLLMVVNLDSSKARPALETLLATHLDSPKLAQMGRMIPYLDRIVDEAFAKDAIAKLLKSESADVRGWALFAKHGAVIEKAPTDGEDYAAAKKELLAAVEVVDDKGLAKEIASAIDLREKFGVGCAAPDIEGVDLDGVAFKLSDYKGKVIFLDFWGDW